MIYALLFLVIYFSIGYGFTLASWLEAAESQVKSKQPVTRFFSKNSLLFIFIWPIVAIHCYRAEVKRDIPDFEYFVEEYEERKRNDT